MKEILARIEALPPMPSVAVRLLEAAQDPQVDLGAVARWLEQDASMTANLLRLCNSPFYGLRKEVTSVRQASSLLGMKQVVQIALTVLSSRYLSSGQAGYGLAAGELWKSSVGAAIAAELLAIEAAYPHPATAYTAGLLEDIGKIVLAEFVAEALPKIWAAAEAGVGFEDAERQAVGMSHSEVGGLLLSRWGFPPALVESVQTHHRPGEAKLDPSLANIAHVADALMMTMGVGLGADGLAYLLDADALSALGLAEERQMESVLERLAVRLAQAEALFASPS